MVNLFCFLSEELSGISELADVVGLKLTPPMMRQCKSTAQLALTRELGASREKLLWGTLGRKTQSLLQKNSSMPDDSDR